MVLPASTWNHPYTFVATLATGCVAVLALTGGAMMLFSQRAFADFDTDLPEQFQFFSRLGVTGIATVLLVFLAVVGGMFLCQRQRIAIMLVLITGGLACLYFGLMLLVSLQMWMRIHWVIM
ncbi:MAG: hypothetical protein R3C45_17420 [Phycisphaerales bacterium]